ncbi:hypothetical protein GOP47_0009122 [Adiantum capillus-veneris]|uniref:Uncharacterized protein n=1 Tax=Adiantum capillus-veneris TaxID=13818 RepID=A0A9D4V0G0_ADICA|nr:hypothetical protein GOP47_0009122 [Adiantum capillus-veneris]
MPPPRSNKRNVPAIKASSGDDGIIKRMNNAVRETAQYVHSIASGYGKKLLLSTGKAAWIAGTSVLVLVVPLIIELDRDAQLAELEGHQATLLGAPSQPPGVLR